MNPSICLGGRGVEDDSTHLEGLNELRRWAPKFLRSEFGGILVKNAFRFNVFTYCVSLDIQDKKKPLFFKRTKTLCLPPQKK